MKYALALLIGLLPAVAFADEPPKDYGVQALVHCVVSQEQLVEKIQELQVQVKSLQDQLDKQPGK